MFILLQPNAQLWTIHKVRYHWFVLKKRAIAQKELSKRMICKSYSFIRVGNISE